jgi:hypothetical protein
MNSSSKDIKHMLEADSGLSLTFATNLFIGKEPVKPDNCVTIFDTTGNGPYLGLDTTGYYYPSIQIRVRNKNYNTGLTLIQNIMIFLHAKHQEQESGTLYSLIQCPSEPAFLDWDDNGNARFVCNFNIQRRVV